MSYDFFRIENESYEVQKLFKELKEEGTVERYGYTFQLETYDNTDEMDLEVTDETYGFRWQFDGIYNEKLCSVIKTYLVK